MQNNPTVFISYSWDNDDHKAWVLNLANRLRDNGVEVILDQYELSLGKNLAHFMERAVQRADKVLLILTENYKLKAEGRTGGVGYEYSMINAELYQIQANNTKFLPVLRGRQRATSIPIFVNAFIDLDMRADAQFEAQLIDLLHAIYEKPKVVKPPLGKMPDFLQNTSTATTTPPPPQPTVSAQITQAKEDHQRAQTILAQQQEIRTLVSGGKTKAALTRLQEIATDQDTDLQNLAIILASRYEDYAKKNRLGIASSQELSITLNQINASLLDILNTLK